MVNVTAVNRDLLKDARRRTTSVQWPDEVDNHLEVLCQLLAAAGTPISRSQLLAALVATAPLDGRRLAQTARRYFRIRIGGLSTSAKPADLPALTRVGRRRRRTTTTAGQQDR